MNLVEDSEYDHEDLGRVRLISVDETAAEVLLELAEPTYVRGVGQIPSGTREAIDDFEQRATPAPITVSTPAATMDAEGADSL